MPCLADDRDLDLDLAVSGLWSLAEVLEGRESAEDFWVLPWGVSGCFWECWGFGLWVWHLRVEASQAGSQTGISL